LQIFSPEITSIRDQVLINFGAYNPMKLFSQKYLIIVIIYERTENHEE